MIVSWIDQTVRRNRIIIPEVELSDDWKEFEQTLGKYKHEYVKTLAQLKIHEEEIVKLSHDVSVLSATFIQNKTLHDDIKHLVEEFKKNNQFSEKQSEFSQLAGKVKAMENILTHTNAHRYNHFTCSVCMDRLIDTFLDPCGHVICRQCHILSMNSFCPLCRTEINAKKIYSTM